MTRQKMANSFLRSSRSHPAPSRTVGHILTWRGKRAANVAFPVTRFLSAVKITDEMTKRLKCIWHVSIRMTYMYDICPPLSLLALPMLSSMIAQWGNGSTTNQPAILNYPVWSCMNWNVNSLALMPLSSKSFIVADSITGCTPQAMLLPSLSSTVMLVTWRSSHQTKKHRKFGKLHRQVIRFLCNFHMKCDWLAVKKLAISFYFSDPTVPSASPNPLPTAGGASDLPECRKLKKLDTTESRAAAALRNAHGLEPCPLKGLRKKGSRIPWNLGTGILGSSQLMRHHLYICQQCLAKD